MSRKFIVAIAAVAALGMSTLIATDASARGFGGGGFGGGHFGGGGHAASFSRASFHPARVTTSRTVNRSFRTTRTTHTPSRVTRTHFARHEHRDRFEHHRDRHWVWWCRHHHHYRCGGYPWIDVGVDGGDASVGAVADGPQAVAATPAAVCNDCDYFLKDEPGCYMAKRAFSTPSGDEELRCVKICEEPEAPHAAK